MAFGLSGRCFTAEIQSIYLYPALEEARLAPKRIYGGTITSIRQSIRYQYTGTPTDPSLLQSPYQCQCRAVLSR